MLLDNADSIIRSLRNANLGNYDYLQRQLLKSNVTADRSYQTKFNGFYRMRQRPRCWYEFFFSILEREKFNSTISFKEILIEIYRTTGRVEPSFSSKMVATINPELIVYDKEVVQNLNLKIPYARKPAQRRICRLIDVYSQIQDKSFELRQNSKFGELRTRFDTTFPQYAHFTDVKKLDLFLWQVRDR